MLAHKRTDADPRTTMENGLGGCSKLNKNPGGQKTSASIRDKISQWEGKKETLPGSGPGPLTAAQKEPEIVRKKETAKTSEVHRTDSKRLVNWDRQDSGKENAGKQADLRPTSPEGPTTKDREVTPEKGPLRGSKPTETAKDREVTLERGPLRGSKPTEKAKDKKSVLTHIKKLEQAMKEAPAKPSLVLPGNYFCPPSKEEQEEAERRANEPIFGTLDVVGPRPAGSTRRRRSGDPENVYTEPAVASPSINPLPKPQRTFQHHTPPSTPTSGLGLGKGRRNLPPLPSIPPPPLPTCPPPGVCRRPWTDRPRDSSNRKSYEFEDLLQSSSDSNKVDWYAQSRPSLTRTLSEENVYEDILDPPSKENLYEDIELERSCLGNKCSLPITSPSSPVPDTPTKHSSKPGFFRQNTERRSFKLLELRKTNRESGLSSPSRISPPSTPSSPDDTPNLSGDPYNRRRRKIPKMVLKINGIFEARRGKKRMKRVSQSTESSSGRDENSESESDTEEKLKAHSQRLSSVQSMLRQTGRYRTLERDLMDLQERKLFEYFIVVALHKTKAGAPYLPVVTQQFPLKLERSFKFMRETEDQLKVIPQFCFPDAKDWAPVDSFPSETFSFVLTGEDGSRRFGYCRRLLPSGKSRRLPEVYCIVSRLGCFDLFSKILDEVEKRRAISPALVQPFMRGIMEAPFPAPGRIITVKNFLPGSGTEVIELCRPSDSRLEHVDFECLFSSLSLRLLLRVFASLLLERRVIFTADKLSTLSQCCHAVVALLYPFTWQHTYIPVLPPAMLDIVCTPTPFIVGLLSSSLPSLKDLPIEEVLVVDLCNSRFLRQLDDEDSILPHKLQAALEHVLDKRKELAGEMPTDSSSLSTVVSETFVRFFVEMVGHYPLFMGGGDREDDSVAPSSFASSCFQREAFRKAVTSKSLKRFLEVFMETQMFAGFIAEREQRRQGLRGMERLGLTGTYRRDTAKLSLTGTYRRDTDKLSLTGTYRRDTDKLSLTGTYRRDTDKLSLTGTYRRDTAKLSLTGTYRRDTDKLSLTGTYRRDTDKLGLTGTYRRDTAKLSLTGTYRRDTAKLSLTGTYRRDTVKLSLTGTYRRDTAKLSLTGTYRRDTDKLGLTGTYRRDTAKLSLTGTYRRGTAKLSLTGTYRRGTAKLGLTGTYRRGTAKLGLTGTYRSDTAKLGLTGTYRRGTAKLSLTGTYRRGTAKLGLTGTYRRGTAKLGLTGTYRSDTAKLGLTGTYRRGTAKLSLTGTYRRGTAKLGLTGTYRRGTAKLSLIDTYRRGTAKLGLTGTYRRGTAKLGLTGTYRRGTAKLSLTGTYRRGTAKLSLTGTYRRGTAKLSLTGTYRRDTARQVLKGSKAGS
ncbi:DENN domain-containing protein 2A isoform X3 [Esox lucius]|nr:DENN domain-containing protein 2A isoform X3 [Esox lucius]